MRHTTITHLCGHAQSHLLEGLANQMERKATWLAKRICPDCFRAEKRAEADKGTAAATAGLDLPALAGSDRQIAWAEKLRVERIAAARTNGDDIAPLLAITDAKQWIDGRAESHETFAASVT